MTPNGADLCLNDPEKMNLTLKRKEKSTFSWIPFFLLTKCDC